MWLFKHNLKEVKMLPLILGCSSNLAFIQERCRVVLKDVVSN